VKGGLGMIGEEKSNTQEARGIKETKPAQPRRLMLKRQRESNITQTCSFFRHTRRAN
jgi:hypothetical protein